MVMLHVLQMFKYHLSSLSSWYRLAVTIMHKILFEVTVKLGLGFGIQPTVWLFGPTSMNMVTDSLYNSGKWKNEMVSGNAWQLWEHWNHFVNSPSLNVLPYSTCINKYQRYPANIGFNLWEEFSIQGHSQLHMHFQFFINITELHAWMKNGSMCVQCSEKREFLGAQK